MNQAKTLESGYQSRICTSIIRLGAWGVTWVGTCALMNYGPKFLWNKDLKFTLLAIGLNVVVGIGLIVAHKNYLTELDDLQRKIYLNALGITVGVALIGGVPFEVMDAYDVIPFHAKISYLIMLMSLAFVGSFLYGTWRYR